MSIYVCDYCRKFIYGEKSPYKDSEVILNDYGFPVAVVIGGDRVDYYGHVDCIRKDKKDLEDNNE